MKALFLRFLVWFGQPSENDQYVEDWLNFGQWRVFCLGAATVALPVLLGVWWFKL
jgi:hypothetical protein